MGKCDWVPTNEIQGCPIEKIWPWDGGLMEILWAVYWMGWEVKICPQFVVAIFKQHILITFIITPKKCAVLMKGSLSWNITLGCTGLSIWICLKLYNYYFDVFHFSERSTNKITNTCISFVVSFLYFTIITKW